MGEKPIRGENRLVGKLPDHRWVQSPRELRLSDILRREIEAGRVTTATTLFT